MNPARQQNQTRQIDSRFSHAPNHERPQFILSSPIEDTQSLDPLFDFDPVPWNDARGFNSFASTSAVENNAYLYDDDLFPQDQTAQLKEINALLKPDTSDPWHLSSDLISASFTPHHSSWPGSSSVGNQIYSSSFDSGYAASTGQFKAPGKARSVHSTGSNSAYRVDKIRRPRSRAASAPLICHDCEPPRTFNNQSELKKDRLRHTKPFRCEFQDCAKAFDGFPTRNDLERHRKAVHHVEPELGDKFGYRCVLCPAPSYAEKKFWPRKDNFKSHIIRKHPDHDVNLVIEESKVHTPMSSYDSAFGSQIDAINERIDEETSTAEHIPSAVQDDSTSPYLPLETDLAGMGLGSTDYAPPMQYMSAVEDATQHDPWPQYLWETSRHSLG